MVFLSPPQQGPVSSSASHQTVCRLLTGRAPSPAKPSVLHTVEPREACRKDKCHTLSPEAYLTLQMPEPWASRAVAEHLNLPFTPGWGWGAEWAGALTGGHTKLAQLQTRARHHLSCPRRRIQDAHTPLSPPDFPGLCFPGPPTSLTSAHTILPGFLPDLLLARRHHPRLSFWCPHLHAASTSQFRIHPRDPRASLLASHPNPSMPNTFRTSPRARPTFASSSTHNLENQHGDHMEEIPDSLVCCQDPPGLALVDFPVISSLYTGLGGDPEWQLWAVPAELS